MNQGMMNTVISAIVGGVVGAGVVFFAGSSGKMDLKNAEMENLKVANLTITNEAVLVNKKDEAVAGLKEGNIFADNVVIAKKFVGQQLQGHAIVANRVFTTPDDLMKVPMNEWKFYTEIGSSLEHGGEVVVRNAQGAAMVNKPVTGGALLRAGFDTESNPQVVAIQNLTRSVLNVSNDLSAGQKQQMNNQQATMPPGAFDNTQGQVPPVATPNTYPPLVQ